MEQDTSATPITVAFRCDANPSIGVGHVTRCLAMAEVARDRGWRVIFLGSITLVPWLSRVTSWIEFRDPSSADRFNILVLDSYSLTASDVRRFRNQSEIILEVIDAVESMIPGADLYLHHGLHAPLDGLPALGSPIVVGGPKHVLIGERLRHAKVAVVKPVDRGPVKVLVSLGGTDPTGLTAQVVQSCLTASCSSQIDVISALPFDLLAGIPKRHHIVVHEPGPSAATLAANADVVVGAAGVTSLEWLYLEKPMAIIQVANNQEQNYNLLINTRVAIGLGRTCRGEILKTKQLVHLINDRILAKEVSDRGQGIIDGLGAQRIIDRVEEQLQARRLRIKFMEGTDSL